MTIKQIQWLLLFLGYSPGEADGINGTVTQDAVRAFQEDWNKAKNAGLDVDGIAGQKTQEAMRQAVGVSFEKPSDTPSPAPVEDTASQEEAWWKEIQYFVPRAFRCTCGKCGGWPVRMQELIVRICDEIRKRAGVPIYIIELGGSGVRCKAHNTEVGGVWNSEHLFGRAADLHSSLPPEKLYEIAVEVCAEMAPGMCGIGLYKWGIHVDTGKYSRWKR